MTTTSFLLSSLSIIFAHLKLLTAPLNFLMILTKEDRLLSFPSANPNFLLMALNTLFLSNWHTLFQFIKHKDWNLIPLSSSLLRGPLNSTHLAFSTQQLHALEKAFAYSGTRWLKTLCYSTFQPARKMIVTREY